MKRQEGGSGRPSSPFDQKGLCLTKGDDMGLQMASLLGEAAVMKPRAGSWGHVILVSQGACASPLTMVGWPSRSSPIPAGCSRFSSRMWRERHTVSRVKLYLLNAQCASSQKTKHKAFPRCFPNSRSTLGWKNGALLPLVFNLPLARFIIKENNLFICLPYTRKDNKLERLHKSHREFL